MCDFCSRDYPGCKANPIFAKQVKDEVIKSTNAEAVIACDGYESPVDVLKRQFH